jgi:polyferredoxin
MSVPTAPERVLPTLNADGTRNRIRPRLYPGRLHSARRVVAYALVAMFVGLPLLRVDGKPAILLDVVHRQFVLFGHTYLATDGVLLMLLMLSIFVSVVLVTALVGRAWCGWGCPQTVYMEFLFRPIERLFEGPREAQLRLDRAGGGWRRLAKNVVFLGLSFVLANVFLAYFVGTDALRHWSVLLDPKSLLIGYDARRGEPRSKGKARQPGHGDCIDCQACVTACPTGIDIRQGLQLECIACGQCADACDSIMDRIKKPRGLIRYSSQRALETGHKSSLLRPRVAIYSFALLGLLSALAFASGGQQRSEITVLRGLGAPFSRSGDDVVNQLRLRIQNRSDAEQTFRVELLGVPGGKLVAPELPLVVPAGELRSASFFVVAPAREVRGQRRIQLRVSERSEQSLVSYTLLGPEGDAGP